MQKKLMSRVDVQVSLLTTAVVIVASLATFALMYTMSYREMIQMMEDDVWSLVNHIEQSVEQDIFIEIQTAEDMEGAAYQQAHAFFNDARMISGTKYLYTATYNDAGEMIYHIDGLDYDDPDFRNVGDLIEPEFQEPLITALAGEIVMPNELLHTQWGDVFVAYYPLHDDQGNTVAAIGVEFPADSQYQAFQNISMYTMWLIIAICVVMSLVVRSLFRRISNPHFKDIYNTDVLTGLKNRTAFELDAGNGIYQKTVKDSTLVLTDLNGLKQVNDQAGHTAGDRYIQACAQALFCPEMRDCVVYRIGGDEFITIVPEAYSAQVVDYMGYVKGKMAVIQCPEIPYPSVSMGYGVCQDNTEEAWEEAQRQADLGMYQDKKQFYAQHPTLCKRL